MAFLKRSVMVCMLWFNFVLGLNFIFLCFKLIIIHYHTQKQKKIEFKRRTKLNHNMYSNPGTQVGGPEQGFQGCFTVGLQRGVSYERGPSLRRF